MKTWVQLQSHNTQHDSLNFKAENKTQKTYITAFKQKKEGFDHLSYMTVFFPNGAPRGNRTPIAGSEDQSSIH